MAVPTGSRRPDRRGGCIRGHKGVETAADHEARLVPEDIADRPDLAAEPQASSQESRCGEGAANPELGQGEGHEVDAGQARLEGLALVLGHQTHPHATGGTRHPGRHPRPVPGERCA